MNFLKKALSFVKNINVPSYIVDFVFQIITLFLLFGVVCVIEQVETNIHYTKHGLYDLSESILLLCLPLVLTLFFFFLWSTLCIAIVKHKEMLINTILSVVLILLMVLIIACAIEDFESLVILIFFSIPLIVNIVIWYFIFKKKYYDVKIIMILTLNFFAGLVVGGMTNVFGGFNYFASVPIWITSILYVIWCVWRKKSEVKRESEKNFKELMGEKENQSPLQ